MRPKSILKNNPENILNHSRKVSIKTRVGDETRSRSRIRTRGHSRSGSDRVKTPMDNWDGNGSTIAGRRSLSTIKQLQELEKVKNMESLGDGRSVRANRDWDDRERGRRYRDYERKEVARSDLFIPKPADYYDPYPKPSPMRTRTRILLDKLTTGKTLTKPMLSFDEIEASIKDILSKNNIRRDTYKSHVDIDTRPRPVPRLRQPKVLFPNHKSQIQRHKFQQTTVVDKCDSGCQATFVYPEINKCSVLVQTEMEEVEKGGGKLFGDLKKFEGNRPKVGYDEYKDESENEREQKELKTLIVKKKSPPISSITKPIALKLQDLQIKEIPKFVKPQVKSSDKYVVNIPTRPQTAPGLVRGNGKVVISKTNYSDIRFKKVGFESPENSFLFSEEYIKDAKSKVGAHVKVKSPMMARKTVDQYTHMSDNEELKDKELKDKDKLTTFNER